MYNVVQGIQYTDNTKELIYSVRKSISRMSATGRSEEGVTPGRKSRDSDDGVDNSFPHLKSFAKAN